MPEQWNGSKREFRQNQGRTSGPRVWTIEVRGPQVIVTYGHLGGKLQTAIETCKGVNIGRSNEKSPEVYALETAVDQIRRKRWEGYREYSTIHGGMIDEEAKTGIDFDNLPDNLSFYKPDNSMGAGITKKALEGKVWYSRKRNGECYIIAKGMERAKLYSRRMLRQHHLEVGTPFTWDDRFGHLVDAAEKVMPFNSILLGELVMDRDGLDSPYELDSILKQLTPGAIQTQAEIGRPSFYIWDIAFWDGQNMVGEKPVRARYDLIHELNTSEGAFIPVQFFESNVIHSPDNAKAVAKYENWEGFVVVDPDGIYGEKAFNFKGKPDRPGTVCAKCKPEYEDDFVVFFDPEKGYGKWSTKERYGKGIHSAPLYQYNSKGELVYICLCGGGLTEQQKREWANPSLYPMVWKVQFTDRRYVSAGDDSNALDHPRLLDRRTDKKPEECVNTLLDPKT
jgi:hypothetical protein